LKDLQSTTTLNNGVKMPWLGLGVYRAKEGEEVISAIRHATQFGYRSIDTAALYENEEGVGKAVRESGIAREKLFITSKVWNTDQGYESTLRAFEISRKKLGLDYLDLYLVHWPVTGKYKETWRALQKIYKDGWVRAIGVSNFQIHHLQDLMADSDLVPAINQVEYHPHLTQKDLLFFCKQHGIQMEAWRPLMNGKLGLPLLKELSKKYNKTPAQIVLRWDLQRGVVTIPKSVTPHRIKENSEIFDFTLSDEDLEKIDSLNENIRYGPDPDNF